MSTSEKTPTEAAPDKPRSKVETLMGSLPVILTVLATILAGLSSSEMTQAQYHRSLAAQNQSKVGDQWGFFQAKKIRGTSMDATADVIAALSEPGSLDPERLKRFCSPLLLEMTRIKKESEKLVKLLEQSKGGSDGRSEAIQQAATRLQEVATRSQASAGENQTKLGALLNDPSTIQALDQVSRGKLPEVKDQPLNEPVIVEVLKAIQGRQTELQTAPLMKDVNGTALRDALETAEENARNFDKACDPLIDKLKAVGLGVADQVKLTRSVNLAARDLSVAISEESVSAAKEMDAVRKSADNITAISEGKKAQAAALYADFIAARHRYNALRYDRESRYNSAIAALLEVQVRKSSWESERHRRRSGLFFFGMLAAQAGVTIATLALAVKLRSLLWGLASAAGFASIVIMIVVYVFV